jgi:hypothetical protein
LTTRLYGRKLKVLQQLITINYRAGQAHYDDHVCSGIWMLAQRAKKERKKDRFQDVFLKLVFLRRRIDANMVRQSHWQILKNQFFLNSANCALPCNT